MLELEAGTKLELDRTNYALKFESAMLQLENLTPHQEKIYKQIAEELRVDIRAPAGAGKTFLALKALLEVLGSEAEIGLFDVTVDSDLPGTFRV